MNTDWDEFPCIDCRTPTCPEGPGWMQTYMVTSATWQAAGMRRGYLCVDCLERRLGRRLAPDDFTDCPLNTWERYQHDRLPYLRRLIAQVQPHAQLEMFTAAE